MRSLLLVTSLSLAVATFANHAWASDPLTGRPVKEDSQYQHHSQFVINFGIQNGGDELWVLRNAETDEQMDKVAGGALVNVIAFDVVDVERNQVAVAIPVKAGVNVALLGTAVGGVANQRPGRTILTQ